MKVLSVSEARDRLADVIGRVQFGSERVTLQRRGKPLAVIVSVSVVLVDISQIGYVRASKHGFWPCQMFI